MVDPFSSITSALSKTGKYTMNTFQVNFSPARDFDWKNNSEKTIKILDSKYPDNLKSLMLSKYFILFKILFFPVTAIVWIVKLLWKNDGSPAAGEDVSSSEETSLNKNILDKLSL
ncbi:MAG: hypothetical protein LBF15_00460 [Candidatus Peribacteria bacterium]|jgi:hypothetical protein|nr:hypothetical protein [Candidatus Peribacteria bacterium]